MKGPSQNAAFGSITTILRVGVVCALLVGAAGFSLPAQAACLPGIPCVTGKTANNPASPSDGPNASGAPNAAKSDSAACDADFMNQIYARAFSESQRERIIAGALLKKPDSVLEYTCFDDMAGIAAQRLGPLFSESSGWSNVSVPINNRIDGQTIAAYRLMVNMGPQHLDQSLYALVMQALQAYGNANFSHEFLSQSGGLDDNLTATLGNGTYACQNMNSVFFLARCENANTDVTYDPLPWYAANDPRNLPSCTSGITADILAVAANRDRQYAQTDPVVTYLENLAPGHCGAPIPTGVMTFTGEKVVDRPFGNVFYARQSNFENMVCANPGCYYDPRSQRCRQ